MEFIMMIGLPGSEKSTYAQLLSEKINARIHSSDEVRKQLYKDEKIQGNTQDVFRILNNNVLNDLNCGISVIYDATNINSKDRRNIMTLLKKYDIKKTAIVMAVPFFECCRKNATRERVVPFKVMDKMYKRFQMPYYYEGFTDIKIHLDEKYNGCYGSCYDYAFYYLDYNQNNPHHPESLGNHLLDVYNYINNKTTDQNLIAAAAIHDCGKPYCKFEDENGISHYFNHENVGSYDSMFFNFINDHVEVGALIAYHMMPFSYYKNNHINMDKYGVEFGDKILMLHEADIRYTK